MTPFDFHRQNAVVEPIDRRLFAKARSTAKDVLLAVAIGSGLALALVQWWSS